MPKRKITSQGSNTTTHYPTQLQESEHPSKLENSQNMIELWPPWNAKNTPTFARTTIDL